MKPSWKNNKMQKHLWARQVGPGRHSDTYSPDTELTLLSSCDLTVKRLSPLPRHNQCFHSWHFWTRDILREFQQSTAMQKKQNKRRIILKEERHFKHSFYTWTGPLPVLNLLSVCPLRARWSQEFNISDARLLQPFSFRSGGGGICRSVFQSLIVVGCPKWEL